MFHLKNHLKVSEPGYDLGADHAKMSKSAGNAVAPDELFNSHGADALRLFEMFMGPIEAAKPWSTEGLDGASVS